MRYADRMRTWFATSVLLLSLAAPAAGQQAQGPWTLAEVRVEGVSRYAAADVVRLSGLTPGASVSLDDVQQAANRLIETGLFGNLAFAYTTNAAGLTLTLKVQEAAWTIPLVPDNIIWMSDDEFAKAMAAEVPGFDGTAVAEGRANEFIATGAERVLARHGVQARVQVRPRIDIATGRTSYTIVALDSGTPMRVCDVRFPGAGAIRERDLQELARDFTNVDYSRSSVSAFADGTLQRVYRERGHWAMRSDEPAVARVTGGCDGLNVTIAVTEGVSYMFAGSRWHGAGALDAAALDRALDLRPGATADVRRLDDGLRSVQRAYQQIGYLTMTAETRPALDDAERRVTFDVTLQEGPQFRMGAITVEQLTERQARDLTERWRIKPGDVFDGVYYREFVARETQRLGGRLRADGRLDAAAAVVNVTLSGIE